MQKSTKWTFLILLSLAFVMLTGCELLDYLPPFEERHSGHTSSGDADVDDDPCKPLLDECETAFAYGENSFVDLGLTRNRWGWEIGPVEANCFGAEPEPFSDWMPIYAAAGRNDISKGVEVGRLHYYYDGEWAIIYYGLWPGYELAEVHTYVDTVPIEKIAPGHYGNYAAGSDLDAPDNHRFAIWGFDCEPIYIVAHAVVCPVEWNPDDPTCYDDDPCDDPEICDDEPCDDPEICDDEPCDDPEICDDEVVRPV